MPNKNSSSISLQRELKSLNKLLEKENSLSLNLEKAVNKKYKKMGGNAIKLLKQKKLHKLLIQDELVFWEVEGRQKHYIILDNFFCECADFQVRVLKRREKNLCYHILAKIIGEKLGLFDVKRLSSEDYSEMIELKIKSKEKV